MSISLEHLNLKHSHNIKSLRGVVKSIDFKNDGFHIVYIPSLKLSAYGKDLKEASEMMSNVVIPDFCETLMSQSIQKVISEFKALGWESNAFFKKQLSKTAHIDVKGILKDFELDEDTVINEREIKVLA